MDEPPQDAWFYPQKGARLGPLTLSDLRLKAQEASLNPQLDLVWTQGMAEWQAASAIEDRSGLRAGGGGGLRRHPAPRQSRDEPLVVSGKLREAIRVAQERSMRK
jgi:hypothetical protein